MAVFTPGLRLSDRYRLDHRVSSGDPAQVWLAHDELLGRPVAVRTAPVREALAAATVCHPHATQVLDRGEVAVPSGPDQFVPFVVLEYLEGEDLGRRLARGPLPWAEATRMAAEVAGALSAAHSVGLAHGDLRPGTVMITPAGAKVIGFGRCDAPASPAADVYALGALLTLALTGAAGETLAPTDAATDADADAAGVAAGPAPPGDGLPAAVRAVWARCLAAAPEARPASHEVATILRAAVRLPVPAGSTNTATPTRSGVRGRAAVPCRPAVAQAPTTIAVSHRLRPGRVLPWSVPALVSGWFAVPRGSGSAPRRSGPALGSRRPASVRGARRPRSAADSRRPVIAPLVPIAGRRGGRPARLTRVASTTVMAVLVALALATFDVRGAANPPAVAATDQPTAVRYGDRQPRIPPDRTPQDQTPHDQTPHDQTPHDQTPHDQTPHDQTPQSAGPPATGAQPAGTGSSATAGAPAPPVAGPPLPGASGGGPGSADGPSAGVGSGADGSTGGGPTDGGSAGGGSGAGGSATGGAGVVTGPAAAPAFVPVAYLQAASARAQAHRWSRAEARRCLAEWREYARRVLRTGRLGPDRPCVDVRARSDSATGDRVDRGPATTG